MGKKKEQKHSYWWTIPAIGLPLAFGAAIVLSSPENGEKKTKPAVSTNVHPDSLTSDKPKEDCPVEVYLTTDRERVLRNFYANLPPGQQQSDLPVAAAAYRLRKEFYKLGCDFSEIRISIPEWEEKENKIVENGIANTTVRYWYAYNRFSPTDSVYVEIFGSKEGKEKIIYKGKIPVIRND